jgi:PLP dependent protein
MSIISTNLHRVQNRIRIACEQANREPSSVKLLAASKRTDANGIREAISLGHYLYGENRAQSLRDKYDTVAVEHPEATWHFIGYLQKNKIKYIVGRASMVHSIDSFELAEALSNRIRQQNQSGKDIPPIKILVQVKFGTEETKTGTPVENVLPLCQKIMELSNIELCGLMTIPPLYGEARDWFNKLSDIQNEGIQQGLPLTELSMGMTSDLEDAIACGATIIRVGTAIFGEQE